MSKKDLGIRNVGVSYIDRKDFRWDPSVDSFPELIGRLIKKELEPDVLDADAHAMRTGTIVEIHGKDYFDTSNFISKSLRMDTDIRELGLCTIKVMSELDQMSLPPENWNHDPRKPNDGGSEKYKKRLLTVVVPCDESAKLQVGQVIQFSNPNLVFNKVLMKAKPSVFVGKEPGCAPPKGKIGEAKVQKKGKPIPKDQIPGIDLKRKNQVWGWKKGVPKQIEVVYVKNYAGRGRYLEKNAAKDFQKMREAAAKEGLKLNVNGGFRTMESQKRVRACWELGKIWRSKGGLKCSSKKVSEWIFKHTQSKRLAKSMGSSRFGANTVKGGKCGWCAYASWPGYSNHQMGKAVDVNTRGFSRKEIEDKYPNKTSSQRDRLWQRLGRGTLYNWLQKHSKKYNFYGISNEHWHYDHRG